jgi:peroxiredoxin
MNKLRKILIGALALTTVACASFAVAACEKKTYPDFINPEAGSYSPDGSSSTQAGYTINVQSVGGLNLSGVKVAAQKNGVTLYEGISNSSGQINFSLLDADEYDLVVTESTLPDGYYIPEGTSFQTSSTEKTVTIAIPSRVITTTASGITYSLGDVMHDFSFSDTEGERYKLSSLLETKKAIVLNFFYTTCSPCKSEFPAIETAYQAFKDDIEIIALSNQDTLKSITSFRSELGLSFFFGQDQASLHTYFSVSSWPTTVIIDRYGVIVYKDSGAITDARIWNAMFAKYTSDDYVQSGTTDDSSSDDAVERVKPTVEEPNYGAVSSVLNGNGTTGKIGVWEGATTDNDKLYNWPWIISDDGEGGKCVTASNVGTNYSYAILSVDVTLKAGDMLSYEYKFNTEAGNDILYVIIDDTLYEEYSGDSKGWQSEDYIYIAHREITINLSFTYLKDEMNDADDEVVSIRNVTIVNAENASVAKDIETSAVSGVVGSNGKYTSYANVRLSNEDGYYHVVNADGSLGAILLADILYATAWSSLHYYDTTTNSITGASTFMAEGSTVNNPTALYWLSWWNMSNWQAVSEDEDSSVASIFYYTSDVTKNTEYAAFIIDEYYLQGFSDNGYVPVTEELKQAMVAFTSAYCTKYNINYYEDQWLELCYYTAHYGPEHADGSCAKNADPILGLEMRNALTAYENINNEVSITKIMKDDYGGGLFYKFVPSSTGVYYFKSNSKSTTVDPLLIILDPSEQGANGEVAKLIKEYDNSEDPRNMLSEDEDYNFYGYAYLTAGKTYYLKLRFATPGETGEYTFNVTYTGKTELDYLRTCTTGDGAFSYYLDTFELYYLAVDFSLESDGYYYNINSDGSTGSLIYIDFVNPNFFRRYYNGQYALGYTLLQMIEGGDFDFTKYTDGVGDLTSVMMDYYYQSIDGKSEDDELYGMLPASRDLVDYISAYIKYTQEENKASGYWLSMANYYEHFGA